LRLSHEMCKALSLVPNRKLKKIKVETREPFKVSNSYLKQLGPTTSWEYLGVPFDSRGLLPPKIELGPMLRKISIVPLKTYQRLEVLRGYLLPRYAHSLAFGRVSDKTLINLDRETRRTVRSWLDLPHDVPVAYMHAQIKAGGLGIPCLRTHMVVSKRNRSLKLEESGSDICATTHAS
jgi:hypothetical protein